MAPANGSQVNQPELVQDIRSSVGAILTGTGTVLADDPLLTVRSLPADKQPLRVIVGDRDLPADSQIFAGENLPFEWPEIFRR